MRACPPRNFIASEIPLFAACRSQSLFPLPNRPSSHFAHPEFRNGCAHSWMIVPARRRAYALHDKFWFNFQRLKQRGTAMRCPSREFLRISVLLCGIALAANAQAPTPPAQAPTKTVRAVQNFVTVTDQTLRA